MAVLFAPVVFKVNAFLPTAVLSFPVTESSKAPEPNAVLPETEFAPLPTVTSLTVMSAVNVLTLHLILLCFQIYLILLLLQHQLNPVTS